MDPIRETEKGALTGDRGDIARLVSAFRKTRAAGAKLLASRYRDGEVDSLALSAFESETEDALADCLP